MQVERAITTFTFFLFLYSTVLFEFAAHHFYDTTITKLTKATIPQLRLPTETKYDNAMNTQKKISNNNFAGIKEIYLTFRTMKNVVLTLCAFVACTTMIAVNSCCKKTAQPGSNVPKDPCSFSTKKLDYEWIFKDTGNISTAILDLAQSPIGGIPVDPVTSAVVENTVSKDLAAQGIDTCQVQQIVAQNLRVTIDSPSTYNFNLVDSIWVSITDKNGGNKKVIANKGGILPGTRQITMNIIPNFNLQSYLLADSFAFSLGVRSSGVATVYNNGPMFLNFEAKFVGTVFTE
jgi:hypothetical protein